MIFLWIIVAIIIFSVVVLIHEWGHFYTARKFWVKVEEFGLGIPPRAKKLFTDKKWTLFSLNWLPIWGFVRLYGENPQLIKDQDDKKALFNKPAWQQSIIILAWVFMNFVLAIFIFSLLFFFWVKPVWVNTVIPTEVESKLIPTYDQAIKSWLITKWEWIALYPLEDSIAEKAGIKEADVLLKIKQPHPNPLLKGEGVESEINTPEDVIKIIWKNSWNKLIFIINRNWKILEIPIIPLLEERLGEVSWKIWSYLWDNIKINENFEYNYWFFKSIKYWTTETYSQIVLTLKWIWLLGKKIFNPETPEQREEAISQVSWPIWIVDFISNSMEAWFKFILIIWAIISINLWVFNLLPIPALDWWRFVFITLNWIIHRAFWKKIISEQSENIIHLLFFILLIALSLIIWYNDVIKIIDR